MRLKRTQTAGDCEVESITGGKADATINVKKAAAPNQDGYTESARPAAFMEEGSVSAVTPRNRVKDGHPAHEVFGHCKSHFFSAPTLSLDNYVFGWDSSPLQGEVSAGFERYQASSASLDAELSQLKFAQDEHLGFERDYYDMRRHQSQTVADDIVETARVDRQIASDAYYYDLQARQYADRLYELDRDNRDYYDRLNRR